MTETALPASTLLQRLISTPRTAEVEPASQPVEEKVADKHALPEQAFEITTNNALRTVVTETFTLDSTTLEVVCTRNTMNYVANIEWSSDLFDSAMRYNVLADAITLDNFYRFVPNDSRENGYLTVVPTQEVISLEESVIYPGWASTDVKKKPGYTKGGLLDLKLRKLRRLRNELETQKGRLRMLESSTRVPHGDGAGEFTIGSQKEIASTEASIQAQNDAAVRLFHGIEQALALLNTMAEKPVVSRWMVRLPSPLGELTVFNNVPAIIDLAISPGDADVVVAEDEDEEG